MMRQCPVITLFCRGYNGRGPMSSTANVRYLKWERPFFDVGIEDAMGDRPETTPSWCG